MATIEDVLSGRARWVVECGDALELMRTIEARGIDHVIGDPPYEKQAHTKQRRVKTRGRWTGGKREVVAKPLAFEPISDDERRAAGLEIARLTKRWAILFCQVEGAMLWRDALSPLETKRIGTWVKPDAMPQLTGDRPGTGYESIVFAHAKGRSKWNGGGRVAVFVHNKGQGSKKNLHETQKPVALMMELIRLFTDPNDVVLDPYCGSASTGVACARLGRRFIGFEIDPVVAKLASERMEAESVGLDLEAYKREQLPLLAVPESLSPRAQAAKQAAASERSKAKAERAKKRATKAKKRPTIAEKASRLTKAKASKSGVKWAHNVFSEKIGATVKRSKVAKK